MSKNSIKNKISFILIIIFISLAWLSKNLFFINELGLDPNLSTILFSAIAASLIIFSFVISKPNKIKITITLIIYIFISFILYADVVYERYYDAILDIDLLGQANQVGDVFDSVISLMYPADILYWLDIPFLLIIMAIHLKINRGYKSRILPYSLLTVGVGIILLLSFTQLKPNYSDQYKVSLVGIIPTHIYDVSESLKTSLDKAVVANSKLDFKLSKIQEQFSINQELQKTSPNFGQFKGKNLIIVQAESLNEFVIGLRVDGKEITPFLNDLVNTSYYYPNIYLQIGRGNTSDAEFVVNNSIYPMSEKGVYQKYPNNNYLSLANVLKEEGYETFATHGNNSDFWNRNEAYNNQGFDTFYHIDHPDINNNEIIGMGISDESIFNQMILKYNEMNKPFYNFIVTLTNHRPFELPEEHIMIELPKEFKGTSTGNYLESVNYFDNALGNFILKLKENNLWEDTIFIVYGDHYGPLPKDKEEIKRLLDVTFDEKERFNIPLVIHHPKQKEGVLNEMIGSQMDIYPTVSQLMGITRPLVQLGKPLDIAHQQLVGFAYETTPYSFYSTTYDYVASHTGVFEDGECIKNDTKKVVNIEYCKKNYNKVFKDIELSRYLLENNMIDQVFNRKAF
ncbi:LTA synthase family protein [Rossellomorea sp. BNER]|uniref:LTA synthase family protein n=1 Tax=Rossellomorea sp. BNER TaxID=2962031 RepID=UPI003AF2AB0C|nr:LTA synthase family protein [Rossellomorea sp. BNER]